MNYRQEDLAKAVMQMTEGRGVDVVFENIGDPTLWPGAFNCLAAGGRMVTVGAHGGGMVTLIYLGITTFSPSTGWVFAFPISAVILALSVSAITGIAFASATDGPAGTAAATDAAAEGEAFATGASAPLLR